MTKYHSSLFNFAFLVMAMWPWLGHQGVTLRDGDFC
jgi:hypothetical protein